MKYILISITSYILCVVQSYLSLYKFKDELSSTCQNCSLISEIIRYSFMILIITLFFFFLKKIKKTILDILLTIFFITICLFVNYSVFESRVASWSSYSTSESFFSIINHSYLYLLFLSITFFLFIKFIVKK